MTAAEVRRYLLDNLCVERSETTTGFVISDLFAPSAVTVFVGRPLKGTGFPSWIPDPQADEHPDALLDEYGDVLRDRWLVERFGMGLAVREATPYVDADAEAEAAGAHAMEMGR